MKCTGLGSQKCLKCPLGVMCAMLSEVLLLLRK